MALWTAPPRFRGESNERTWLYRVAHNSTISFVIVYARFTNHEAPPAHNESSSLAESPEGEVIETQRRERPELAVGASQMPGRRNRARLIAAKRNSTHGRVWIKDSSPWGFPRDGESV